MDVAAGSRGEASRPVEFETAFRELFPRSYRVAVRILGDGADAEDAAAEALARAHASWKKVGTMSYRDAWVLRVTANPIPRSLSDLPYVVTRIRQRMTTR